MWKLGSGEVKPSWRINVLISIWISSEVFSCYDSKLILNSYYLSFQMFQKSF